MRSKGKKPAPLLYLAGLLIVLGGCGGSSLEGLEEDLARVVEEAGPSVVCIRATNEGSGESKFGSGVILDDGYILTTENILDNVDNVTLKLQDGRIITHDRITKMLCDYETNVSLIRVEEKELKPVRMSKAGETDNGRVGIALGNTNYSKGLDVNLGTVTKSWIGGVDAYDESLMIWHGPEVPYHGGTPIFNCRGELLGLTEGVPKGEKGVIFVLPAKTCMRVTEVLKKEGQVKRGCIGIFCETKFEKCEEGKKPEGVLVTRVIERSPAFVAGLNAGDRIISFNGKPVESPDQLRKLVSATEVGSHILLGVIHKRGNKKKDVLVKTVEHDGLGMRRCPLRSI